MEPYLPNESIYYFAVKLNVQSRLRVWLDLLTGAMRLEAVSMCPNQHFSY